MAYGRQLTGVLGPVLNSPPSAPLVFVGVPAGDSSLLREPGSGVGPGSHLYNVFVDQDQKKERLIWFSLCFLSVLCI